jgi:hypothetical protein
MVVWYWKGKSELIWENLSQSTSSARNLRCTKQRSNSGLVRFRRLGLCHKCITCSVPPSQKYSTHCALKALGCSRNCISFRLAVGSFAGHCTRRAKTVQNKETCVIPSCEHFAVIWAYAMHSSMTSHILSSGTTSLSEATYIMHCNNLE